MYLIKLPSCVEVNIESNKEHISSSIKEISVQSENITFSNFEELTNALYDALYLDSKDDFTIVKSDNGFFVLWVECINGSIPDNFDLEQFNNGEINFYYYVLVITADAIFNITPCEEFNLIV